MKLYDYFRSSACYRVRIALNLKKISYEKIPIHLVNNGGEQYHADYQTLNPQALVPTLDENGHILTQSLAIIEYLEDICPEPPLLPKNPLAKAQVRSLALLIACDMHPLNNLRVRHFLEKNLAADGAIIIDWQHHWLKRGFDAFEAQLSKRHHPGKTCYGNEPSLADICLIPQVYNAKRLEFSLEAYPRIQAIDQYCRSLPAFQLAGPEY